MLKKVSLLIVSLVLAFLVSEATVRVVSSCSRGIFRNDIQPFQDKLNRKDASIHRRDDVLGWVCVPNAHDATITSEYSVEYKINSKGLRDKERNYRKQDGIYRIIFLGESNTFGTGIECGRRYSDIIEELLSKVEVINMSISGFGIDQDLLFLEKEGFKYNPDLVVLFINRPGIERCSSFFLSNMSKPRFELDVTGQSLILVPNAKQVIVQNQEPAGNKSNSYSARSEAENKRSGTMFRKSALFNICEHRFYRTKLRQELREQDKKFWDNLNKNNYANNLLKTPDWELSKIIRLILDRYANDCKKNNVKFLIVNMDVTRLPLIEEYCGQKGIGYYDLSGVLAGVLKTRNLFFDIDPHYNELGHRITGEYSGDYLSDKYKLRKNQNYRYQYLDRI